MWPGIQIQVRNTPFLQLASFEETFTQGMQMQNSNAKQFLHNSYGDWNVLWNYLVNIWKNVC